MLLARTIRVSLMGLFLAGGFSPEIQAAESRCSIVGQHDMLMVQLFFGQSEEGQEIKPEEWKSFLADTVTPCFPFGIVNSHARGRF
jgi:hypothetical protein